MRKRHAIVSLTAIPLLALAIYFHTSPAIAIIANIELILIGLVVTVFVFAYARRNWRANPYGRALMYSKLSLFALCWSGLLTVFLGTDYEYRAVVRAFLFAAVLVAQTRLLQLLFHLRNPKARNQYAIDHEESNADSNTHRDGA